LIGPILNGMKIFALSLLGLAALLAAGCGGGSSSSATAPPSRATTKIANPRNRFARDEYAFRDEIRRSPQAVAYESTKMMLGSGPMTVRLERGLRATIPKATAFLAYIRSVPVPSCLRSLKHRLTKSVAEARTVYHGYLAVLGTGNEAALEAFSEKANKLMHANARPVSQWIDQREHEGGNGGC
jgi:hypothetical protein